MASASNDDPMTDVSIIVCTWNNSRRLALTLDAIAGCHIPDGLRREIVVVDNNCTDDSPAVIRRFAARLPVVAVEERRQGLSHARNRGLRAASGALVVFADDDIRPCAGWVTTYWSTYRERPSRFFFGGPLTCEYEAGPPDADLLPLAGFAVTGVTWGPAPRSLAPHERFMGANWACPSAALKKIGGFDVRLGLDASLGARRVGEEWDLMHRLRHSGMTPWYLPEATVAHWVPAHKCHRAHVAENWEAQGRHVAVSAVRMHPLLHAEPRLRFWAEERSPRLGGVPCRALRGFAASGLRWLLARMRGRTALHEYMAWRFCLGLLKGYRERQRRPIPPSGRS